MRQKKYSGMFLTGEKNDDLACRRHNRNCIDIVFFYPSDLKGRKKQVGKGCQRRNFIPVFPGCKFLDNIWGAFKKSDHYYGKHYDPGNIIVSFMAVF